MMRVGLNYSRRTRRDFVKSGVALALTTGFPSILRGSSRGVEFRNVVTDGRPLRVATIGAGGKGYMDTVACARAGAQIVALCDVDLVRAERTFKEFPLAARYRDYRVMLNEMSGVIDGVIISTPDHTHFPATMMALEKGMHVYVQKPLAHTIGETRALKEAALNSGLVTQMGNQGHANEGTRLLKEWVEAGVIGEVREVHSWTDRPVWPQGMQLPEAESLVPDSLDWKLWLGTAPEYGYSSQIAPFKWRGLWDFGAGALGDMGCHLMDAAFWALDLRGAVRVSARCDGNSEIVAPSWSVVTYEFPRRGKRSPLKYFWYDGGKLPPIPEELESEEEFPKRGGTLYVGSKGKILNYGNYGEAPRLIPKSRMSEFKRHLPAKTIPRIPKGDAYGEWVSACLGGTKPGSSIQEYSADLTELVHLGNLAIRMGRPVDWDPIKAACIGMPEADRYIHKYYRVF